MVAFCSCLTQASVQGPCVSRSKAISCCWMSLRRNPSCAVLLNSQARSRILRTRRATQSRLAGRLMGLQSRSDTRSWTTRMPVNRAMPLLR